MYESLTPPGFAQPHPNMQAGSHNPQLATLFAHPYQPPPHPVPPVGLVQNPRLANPPVAQFAAPNAHPPVAQFVTPNAHPPVPQYIQANANAPYPGAPPAGIPHGRAQFNPLGGPQGDRFIPNIQGGYGGNGGQAGDPVPIGGGPLKRNRGKGKGKKKGTGENAPKGNGGNDLGRRDEHQKKLRDVLWAIQESLEGIDHSLRSLAEFPSALGGIDRSLRILADSVEIHIKEPEETTEEKTVNEGNKENEGNSEN